MNIKKILNVFCFLTVFIIIYIVLQLILFFVFTKFYTYIIDSAGEIHEAKFGENIELESNDKDEIITIMNCDELPSNSKILSIAYGYPFNGDADFYVKFEFDEVNYEEFKKNNLSFINSDGESINFKFDNKNDKTIVNYSKCSSLSGNFKEEYWKMRKLVDKYR